MSHSIMDDFIQPTTKAIVTSIGGVRTIDDLAGLEFEELVTLRAEIDKHLPAVKLSDVNLAQELVLQFQSVKHLQTSVLALGSKVSAQQQAAVANSCTSSLAHLVRLQTELHTAERLKTIEQILIQVIRDQPMEFQQAFFDRYERMLGHE